MRMQMWLCMVTLVWQHNSDARTSESAEGYLGISAPPPPPPPPSQSTPQASVSATSFPPLPLLRPPLYRWLSLRRH